MDKKQRFLFPASLKKQFAENEQKAFWVHRGVSNFLRLYSLSEWERLNRYIVKLNPLSTKVQNFQRMFRAGATRIELDAAGRMHIDKKLLDYAGITDKAVLSAQGNYVEIWQPAALDQFFGNNKDKFEDMSEEISSGNFMNPFE